MVSSDLLCAVWQVGLAVVAAGNGPPAVALVFAALTSATGVVYQPSTAATIPSLVDEDDLDGGQRAQQHDRRAGRDRGPRGRRGAAGGRLAVARVRAQRGELRDLGGDRVADQDPQPPGRRHRGRPRRRAGADDGRRADDPRSRRRANAGRLQRAGQLRLRHRHGAVRRCLRAQARAPAQRGSATCSPASESAGCWRPRASTGSPARGAWRRSSSPARSATACPRRC